MATDHIRYDVLARDALRGVLRRVLADAAEHGLPGDHHFFITFLSTAEGVKLSSRLLAQYPDEMTIILQHQFWDLVVTEDRFEVGLSFGGIGQHAAQHPAQRVARQHIVSDMIGRHSRSYRVHHSPARAGGPPVFDSTRPSLCYSAHPAKSAGSRGRSLRHVARNAGRIKWRLLLPGASEPRLAVLTH